MTQDELRGLQKTELQILLAIDKVCSENDIEYFLDSGTMLGAARHGGFIPWDDDVDIAMPRDSYERFLEIGQEALGPRFFLQTRETDPEMLQSFAKVRMNGTEMVEEVGKETGSHQGIWVDIFPFDVICSSELNIKIKRIQWKLLHKLYTIRLTNKPQADAGIIKRIIRLFLHCILSPIPLSFFINRLDDLGDENIILGEECLTCFHYYTVFVPLKHDDVYPLGQMDFEGHSLSVLHNWEHYLEVTYGDWKQLPPEEKRRTHSVVCLKLPDDSMLADV